MTLAAGASGYRPDVDGLRAVAVLSVLVFHAFPAALPGGFIGVDVFFVISGFLISKIILTELQHGTFTFAGFYGRRIRRIFPALALVLLATLIAGWLILFPVDYRQLGAHAMAGAAFVSNILLWQEAGDYFDTSAELKPLLHLWSLGVEEQYYFLWPLLLFFVGRHSRAILWLILGIAGVSFALNIVKVDSDPSAAFYLPFTRFWELMFGSLAAYAHVHRPQITAWLSAPRSLSGEQGSLQANVAAMAGTALIVTGLVMVNELRAFPGWWALLPACGALLLIAAGPHAWINRHVLANPAMVFVGLISYPLYLWHWPLLTYARILSNEDPSAGTRVGALAVSALLAWLTYRFVEKKVRHARPMRMPSGPVVALAGSVAALGAVGLLAFTGVSSARSAAVPYLEDVTDAVHDWENVGDERIAGDTDRAVLFFGDSHMQQYLPRIEAVMRERAAPVRTVLIHSRGGCTPIPGLERKGRSCSEFVDAGFAMALRPEVEIVVIGASWPGFTQRDDYFREGQQTGRPLDLMDKDLGWALQDLEQALQRLVAAGKRVILVLSSPRGDRFDPTLMVRRVGLDFEVDISPPVQRDTIRQENAYIDDRLRQIAARTQVELIDPADTLCADARCPITDRNGHPLYKDKSHLRSSFTREHFAAFDPFIYLDGPPALTYLPAVR